MEAIIQHVELLDDSYIVPFSEKLLSVLDQNPRTIHVLRSALLSVAALSNQAGLSAYKQLLEDCATWECRDVLGKDAGAPQSQQSFQQPWPSAAAWLTAATEEELNKESLPALLDPTNENSSNADDQNVEPDQEIVSAEGSEEGFIEHEQIEKVLFPGLTQSVGWWQEDSQVQGLESARSPSTQEDVPGGVDAPDVPSESMQHRRSQTQMCKFFQAGRCGKGLDCNFAHLTQNRLRTRICEYWRRDPNGCRNGDACTFAHGIAKLHPSAIANCNVGRFHHCRMPTKMCSFFASGTCSKGIGCPFAHDEAELLQKDMRAGQWLTGMLMACRKDEPQHTQLEQHPEDSPDSLAAGAPAPNSFQ